MSANSVVNYTVDEGFKVCTDNNNQRLGGCEAYTHSIAVHSFDAFAGSGVDSYQLSEIVQDLYYTNDDARLNNDGDMVFGCLPPSNYNLYVQDDVTVCTAATNIVVTGDEALALAITDYNLQHSYYHCVATTSQAAGDTEVGSLQILAINGVALPTDPQLTYTFFGSDYPACNTPIGTQLAKGNYTVTITDTQTGCSLIQSFAINYINMVSFSGDITVAGGVVIDVEVPPIFDDMAQVRVTLPQDMYLSLKVYNSNGSLVKTFANNEFKLAGIYNYLHNASGLPNGVYQYVVKIAKRKKNDAGFKY